MNITKIGGKLCCLSLKFKMVVRGFGQTLSSISDFEMDQWCTSIVPSVSIHVTIRLKLLNVNTIFYFYMTRTFGFNNHMKSNVVNHKFCECQSEFRVIENKVLTRKSVYGTALLGVEDVEGPKDTVELNVEWSRQRK